MALHKTLHHISSVSFVNRTWAKNAERREINFFEQEIVFFSFAMLFFQLAMCGWMDGWTARAKVVLSVRAFRLKASCNYTRKAVSLL